MSKKFVRNITNTKLRGKKIEPLKTNVQNDLLSDDKDVFVRNGNEPTENKYHCLTDNLKTLETESGRIVSFDIKRNKALIDVIETKISSNTERLKLVNVSPNVFKLNGEKLDSDIEKIDSDIVSLKAENTELKERLGSAESLISDLETRISSLESEV